MIIHYIVQLVNYMRTVSLQLKTKKIIGRLKSLMFRSLISKVVEGNISKKFRDEEH